MNNILCDHDSATCYNGVYHCDACDTPTAMQLPCPRTGEITLGCRETVDGLDWVGQPRTAPCSDCDGMGFIVA